ncbi:hypothetical protein GCM10011399_19720 [Subtercola lobariae]|uniref:Uncharacterized protein n=1 Tax=Subtercola lobariae TaxID=1588641 RepID=A0A917EWS0_9MICO|nr:hypothetical protein GCM10011399_19720 [Subtercola lobariae]
MLFVFVTCMLCRFQLKRRMLHVEMLSQTLRQLIEKNTRSSFGENAAVDHDVRRKNRFARGDRPDVNVVYVDDPRGTEKVFANLLHVGFFRGRLDEHSHHIAQQHHRTRNDHDGDSERRDGVCSHEAGEQNHDGRGDHRDRADRVAEHLEVGAAHVERLRVSPAQNQQCADVRH